MHILALHTQSGVEAVIPNNPACGTRPAEAFQSPKHIVFFVESPIAVAAVFVVELKQTPDSFSRKSCKSSFFFLTPNGNHCCYFIWLTEQTASSARTEK